MSSNNHPHDMWGAGERARTDTFRTGGGVTGIVMGTLISLAGAIAAVVTTHTRPIPEDAIWIGALGLFVSLAGAFLIWEACRAPAQLRVGPKGIERRGLDRRIPWRDIEQVVAPRPLLAGTPDKLIIHLREDATLPMRSPTALLRWLDRRRIRRDGLRFDLLYLDVPPSEVIASIERFATVEDMQAALAGAAVPATA